MNTKTIKMLSEQAAQLECLNRALKTQIEINDKRLDLIYGRIAQILQEGGEGDIQDDSNNRVH